MSRHYNKEGKPLDFLEWARIFEDMSYRRVAETELPNGKWVSTVWLGIDHNFLNAGPPLIFESMVFTSRNGNECDMRRYTTEEEAKRGHAELVAEHA